VIRVRQNHVKDKKVNGENGSAWRAIGVRPIGSLFVGTHATQEMTLIETGNGKAKC
jgi:hypothetical protein